MKTKFWLAIAVGTLVARWPNLRVEILEGVWDRLAEGLVKHEIDLALSMAIVAVSGMTGAPADAHASAAPAAGMKDALTKPVLKVASTEMARREAKPRATSR